MKDFRDTIKYWWLAVIWPAIRFAFPISGFKDRAIDVLVSLLVALTPIFVLRNISQLPDLGANIQTGLVWLGVTVVLRFAFACIYYPAMEHKKLGGFLEKPLKINAMPQTPLIGVERWASLRVENSTAFRVDNCTLTLKAAVDNSGLDVLRTSERLTWSGRDQTPEDRGDRPKTIIGKGWRVCDVAQTQNELNRIVFTTWFNNNQTALPGKYRLTVESNGELATPDGTKGFSNQHPFRLTYSGGYDVKIENVEP